MEWSNLIIIALETCASVFAIGDHVRGLRADQKSPFTVVPVEEIFSKLSSPLRSTPPIIQRELQISPSSGLTVLLGSSGVGKTRQAADLAIKLSEMTGASTIYLARGYVRPGVSLPIGEYVRRVIVLIDDYDWGFPSAASSSFLERQAAYVEAAVQIRKLYTSISTRCDVHGMFVTVNTHRMPLTITTCRDVFPDGHTFMIPPATPDEYGRFAEVVADLLGIHLPSSTKASLIAACDGRFDTVATFLQTFNSGSRVTDDDVSRFSTSQRMAWDIFRKRLSAEQKWFHGQVKLLRDFGLPPHLDYLSALARVQGMSTSRSDIELILASMWPMLDEQSRVYDGQFGPPDRRPDTANIVIRAATSVAHRRRRSRYAYQDKMKSLGTHLQNMPPQVDNIHLMKWLAKWYPRDRFFAYFLAVAHAKREHNLRAILALYRVFRHPDPRAVYSGKWIEIRAHLLLAKLYQRMKIHENRNWNAHQMLEHEFRLCAALADIEVPDSGPDGYGFAATSSPEIVWKDITEKDLKKFKDIMKKDLKELGYEKPSTVSLDTTILRAVVHHEYSSYLLRQTHREHDAIRHEEIAANLLPEYGEAFLNCATACLQTGDSSRALSFISKAEVAGPRDMESAIFDYLLSREKCRGYMDQGDITETKKWFARCVELSNTAPLSSDKKLRKSLAETASDLHYWDHAGRLAEVREKRFENFLTYRVVPANLTIVLPSDWKIDREGVTGTTGLETLFIAIFSSQVVWDETTKTPSDASITLYYTSCADDLKKTTKEYGLFLLQQMSAAHPQRMTWNPQPARRTLGSAVEYRWNFEIGGDWPKSGFMLIYEVTDARIQLGMMCEACGRAKFWPLFSSVSDSFSRQNFM
jgi:tetratricopeptide (TPR) repeat protein